MIALSYSVIPYRNLLCHEATEHVTGFGLGDLTTELMQLCGAHAFMWNVNAPQSSSLRRSKSTGRLGAGDEATEFIARTCLSQIAAELMQFFR